MIFKVTFCSDLTSVVYIIEHYFRRLTINNFLFCTIDKSRRLTVNNFLFCTIDKRSVPTVAHKIKNNFSGASGPRVATENVFVKRSYW